MKTLKKVFLDIVFVAALLAVMLVFCGFKGETTICGNPHDYTVEAKGAGCSVQEISTKEQAIFEASITEGKSAKVTISGTLEGEQANIVDLFLALSQDVACSEVIMKNDSQTKTSFKFDLGIPTDIADGTEIDILLQVPGVNDDTELDDLAMIRLIVRRVQPAALPGTGDHGMLTFWLLLLAVSCAGLVLLRRGENGV